MEKKNRNNIVYINKEAMTSDFDQHKDYKVVKKSRLGVAIASVSLVGLLAICGFIQGKKVEGAKTHENNGSSSTSQDEKGITTVQENVPSVSFENAASSVQGEWLGATVKEISERDSDLSISDEESFDFSTGVSSAYSSYLEAKEVYDDFESKKGTEAYDSVMADRLKMNVGAKMMSCVTEIEMYNGRFGTDYSFDSSVYRYAIEKDVDGVKCAFIPVSVLGTGYNLDGKTILHTNGVFYVKAAELQLQEKELSK